MSKAVPAIRRTPAGQWLSLHRLLLIGAVAGFSVPAAAQSSQGYSPSWVADYKVPSDFVFHSPLDRESWKLGFYAGAATSTRFAKAASMPWTTIGNYYDAHLVAANIVYRAVDLPNLPISVEIDFAATYQTGFSEHYAEFRLTPTFRWKWFPWNNFIYTNFRVGPLGISYATKVTSFEISQLESNHSNKLLNSTIIEWTFAPRENSPWEVFWRIDHRCGIYGLIDDVKGGTNYMTAGFRASF